MLYLVLALSLSGGLVDRPSTHITATPPRQHQVKLADGSVGIPPTQVAEGGVGVPPRTQVAEGGVGVPPRTRAV